MGIDARQLDRTSIVPLYYQLQELLKEEIEHGRWGPGEVIPSEAELASTLHISRTVIRNALDILEGDGQVFRVKGKGTVVAQPKVWYDAVTAAKRFAQEPPNPHAELSKVIECRLVSVGAQIAKVLTLPRGAVAILLAYVQSVDGVPATLCQTFLRCDASSKLQRLIRGERLPELVVGDEEVAAQLAARYGLTISTSEVIIEATRANDFEAGLLNIGINTPVFLVSTIDLRPDRMPVAFTRMIARGDTFRFAVRIRRTDQRKGSRRPPSHGGDGQAGRVAPATKGEGVATRRPRVREKMRNGWGTSVPS